MKVELLPNVVNDLSALASLPESGDVKIEYISGGDDSDLIFVATLENPLASIDNSKAQYSIYCDRDNKGSDRTIGLPLGSRVYAWYRSSQNRPATILVSGISSSSSDNLRAMDSRSTQHGEGLFASREPITQITAEYGLTDSELTAALGGSNSAVNGMFESSTSTSPTGVAAIISSREGNQAPGQSMTCILDAKFSPGAANSTQQAGMIQSESALCFGYNGTEFGILRATNGALEHQELTITTGATAPETATVVVDGVTHSVPLSGQSEANVDAYEIAKFLRANEPRYRASSNGAVVTVLANLPDFGAGVFSYSSATSVGSWSEINNGTLPSEEWYPQSTWNVYKAASLNPEKLNEYMIKLDGNVNFYVKDDISGEFEHVHSIRSLNNDITPAIRIPTLRVGWGCRNTGNTTDISVSGSFGAIFNEGKKQLNSPTLSSTNTQLSVGTSRTNIISFRNTLTYQSLPNRSEILPQILTLSSESGKVTTFEVVRNPEVATGDLLQFEYLNEGNSLMEVAKNDVVITGGEVVASFTVIGSSLPIDINQIVGFQIPGSEFAITGRNKVNNDADLTVSGTWKEDR